MKRESSTGYNDPHNSIHGARSKVVVYRTTMYDFAQNCSPFWIMQILSPTSPAVMFFGGHPFMTSVRQACHTDSKCRISFGDWFWHLIVENRSIVLNFHQQRPVSALKNHPRPQRPKRPMKAKKGHQRPKLSKIIDFINNQCKIINKLECHTKKKLFFKNW